MIPKEDLLRLAKREFATTLKVMRAFPADRRDFRPHERSSDAMKLFSTFVFEAYLLDGRAFGTPYGPAKFAEYKPADLGAAIADFERESENVLRKLEAADGATLERTIAFAGGEFRADEFVLMMLCDQIHHRGQLSVYVRLAGGKVPSIYGPSADDPSTNL